MLIVIFTNKVDDNKTDEFFQQFQIIHFKKNTNMKKVILLLSLVLTANIFAQTTVVEADFSSYTNGTLVGQNNWVQYNTATLNPLTIVNNKVTIAGGRNTDGQDAFLPFASVIQQPALGTTELNFDVVLTVTSAGANPSYFLALNALNTNTTSGNYMNARLVAMAMSDGFVFGTRVNSNSGYPYTYGINKLSFGTKYAVRLRIEITAGNANDVIKLYTGSDFNNMTLQATSAYSTGTVTDPVFGGILISQYGSASTHESGVTIESIKVTNLSVTTGLNPSTNSLLKLVVSGNNLLVKNAFDGLELEIFTALGHKIQTSKVENAKISIANLKRGLYVVRFGKLAQKIML